MSLHRNASIFRKRAPSFCTQRDRRPRFDSGHSSRARKTAGAPQSCDNFFVTHVHARSLRVKHTTCYELSLPIKRRSVVGGGGIVKGEQRAVSQAFTK